MNAPKLAIVVVSDIHAGPDSPYLELRTVPFNSSTVRTAFHSIPQLAAAIEVLLTGVPPKNRVLICAGDLSTGCHSIELEMAAKALIDLANRLKIPKNQRLLVPGNHDIDWPLTELSLTDKWYDKYRQQKFVDVLGEHAKTFKYPFDGKPTEVSILSGGAFFYMLDSAHEDRKKQEPHRGRLGAEQIKSLDELLARRSGAFRCVVLHHHVAPFVPTFGVAEFSMLEDAADLMLVLQKHAVPLLLHGHQHCPFFFQHLLGASPLTVVSSGSTTAAYKHLPQDVPNTFQVILLDDLHPTLPKGAVHTRMLTLTSGWQPPILTRHHVAARRPFGAPVFGTMLERWADEAIVKCEDEKLLHLEEFLLAKPDGQHCCPHAFSDVIKRRLVLAPPPTALKIVIDADTDRVLLQVDSKGAHR